MKKKELIIFASITIAIIFAFVVINVFAFPKKYKNYVIEYSNKYGIDTALVYAIIKTESNFDKNAKSSAGALGLMQLMPSTAKWIASELSNDYSDENLYDPETNINYGCFYLNYLYQKFNNTDVVICAYNAGETAVLAWIDDDGNLSEDKISYSETKKYLKKVKSYYRVYKISEIAI